MTIYKNSIKSISCLIFILAAAFSQEASAKGGYYWDLYCKESGRSGATATCIPAKEGPWVYTGGSYTYRYNTAEHDSVDAVSGDMARYVDKNFHIKKICILNTYAC